MKKSVEFGATDWPEQLGLGDVSSSVDELPAPDQEALFEGLVNFLVEGHDAQVETPQGTVHVDSSSALFLPATRIFVSLDDLEKMTLEKAVRLLAGLFVEQAQNPKPFLLLATADAVISLLKKFVRLDERQFMVARAVIEAGGAAGAASEREIRLRMKDHLNAAEASAVISSLQEQRVVQREGSDWRIRP